ncbi:MAG TPA: carboxypeptidase-like regulatory domain-containing protein [Candidatus Wallbacteria bacterium]|nr:carboxypeptidase-like regulatory domain-containing protein [Candidatus Wallbacteria bacterium]
MLLRNVRFMALIAILSLFISGCGGGAGGSSVTTTTPTEDPTQGQAQSSITGYVTYGETALTKAPLREAGIGTLVSGATVELRKASDVSGTPVKTTTTTASGKFSFNGLSTASYVITAKITDGTTVLKNESKVDMTSSSHDYYIQEQSISLVKASNLSVTVKDTTGAYVSGASVILNDLRSQATDSSGKAVFSETPRGTYTISISKAMYVTNLGTLTTTGTDQSFQALLIASDSPLKNLTISDISLAPQSYDVYESAAVTLTVTSDNPNAGNLNFNWNTTFGNISDNAQSEISGGKTSSQIKWTAPSINFRTGEFYSYQSVSVAISDQKGASANRSVQLRVLKSGTSKISITSTPGVIPTDIGQKFSYQAMTAPASNVKFEKLDGPSGLTVSTDGLVEWTPSAYGEYTAVIKATETTGGYYDIQRISISAARYIPALAAGETFSKTVLKPGSGLSTSIRDLSADEYILAIPYNKSSVYNSYQMNIYANNQATAAMTAMPPKSPTSENMTPELAGQIRRDNSMRSLEIRNAQSKLDDASFPQAKAPADRSLKAPVVGDTMTFYSLNSLSWPPSESDWTRVTAKLRAIGSRCYIYEDESVSYPYMALTSADISRFVSAFDNEIYPKDTATFGSEPTPGVDNDAKIYILFTKNVNYQTAAGYFDSTNQLKQSYLDSSRTYNKNSNGEKYYSNEKEMFYMSVPKQSFQGTNYQVNTLGVLAHEFQHMINWNQHNNFSAGSIEDSWLNEGLSQVAQDICGYGYQYGTLAFIMDPFLRSPESYSLTKFQFGLGYYGYAYLFTRYLIDRGAVPQNLVKTSNIGKANVEAEVKRAGLSSSFDDFFEDFTAALYLSNTGITSDAKYNFKSVNLRTGQNDSPSTKLSGPAVTRNLLLPASFESSSLYEYGFQIIKCAAASTASQKFSMTDNTSGNIGVIILRIKK